MPCQGQIKDASYLLEIHNQIGDIRWILSLRDSNRYNSWNCMSCTAKIYDRMDICSSHTDNWEIQIHSTVTDLEKCIYGEGI